MVRLNRLIVDRLPWMARTHEEISLPIIHPFNIVPPFQLLCDLCIYFHSCHA